MTKETETTMLCFQTYLKQRGIKMFSPIITEDVDENGNHVFGVSISDSNPEKKDWIECSSMSYAKDLRMFLMLYGSKVLMEQLND